MEIMWAIFAMTILFVVLRTEVTLRARFKAIDVIHDFNNDAFDGHRFDDCMEYRLGSINLMILDLSKWTFKQFYPNLAPLIKEVA